MRVIAIVEIPEEGTALLRRTMVRAAYFASRGGAVVVLAPRDLRDSLDRELDAVVTLEPCVHGVLYGETDDAWVWLATRPGTLVIASSCSVRGRALATGAECVDLIDGMSALESLSTQLVRVGAEEAGASGAARHARRNSYPLEWHRS